MTFYNQRQSVTHLQLLPVNSHRSTSLFCISEMTECPFVWARAFPKAAPAAWETSAQTLSPERVRSVRQAQGAGGSADGHPKDVTAARSTVTPLDKVRAGLWRPALWISVAHGPWRSRADSQWLRSSSRRLPGESRARPSPGTSSDRQASAAGLGSTALQAPALAGCPTTSCEEAGSGGRTLGSGPSSATVQCAATDKKLTVVSSLIFERAPCPGQSGSVVRVLACGSKGCRFDPRPQLGHAREETIRCISLVLLFLPQLKKTSRRNVLR